MTCKVYDFNWSCYLLMQKEEQTSWQNNQKPLQQHMFSRHLGKDNHLVEEERWEGLCNVKKKTQDELGAGQNAC